MGSSGKWLWQPRASIDAAHLDGTVPIVATLVAAIGFGSLPSSIYGTYGTFWLERTWANVSCAFTEGYGAMFPFVVAPMLTVATLLRELIILRQQGKFNLSR
ncbi:MAG: hypothetical protein WA628_26385 [Terriglobales bacterium]